MYSICTEKTSLLNASFCHKIRSICIRGFKEGTHFWFARNIHIITPGWEKKKRGIKINACESQLSYIRAFLSKELWDGAVYPTEVKYGTEKIKNV